MKINPTNLPGCLEICPEVFCDTRGKFVKVFHQGTFAKHKLETAFVEEYYSISRRRVLRGLHFQRPPYDHAKLVYCVLGKIMDVVVDLRMTSPSYGQFVTEQLSDEKANALYISSGMAHGFYVLSDTAIVVYKVTSMYSEKHDSGILWNSLGIPWPDKHPILSERDKTFVAFSNFQSPFRFQA